MFKERGVRWMLNVLRIMEMKYAFKYLCEVLQRRDYVGALGVDKKLILRRILRKYGVGIYTVFNWAKMGHVIEFL
jgi:hypothetical protein